MENTPCRMSQVLDIIVLLKLKIKTRSYESKRDDDPDSEETRVALRALKRSR